MIVITGASDGLGREIAGLYLQAGKRVIGICRGPCIEGVQHLSTDLTDERDIAAAAKAVNQDSELLEALIHCAGVLSLEKIDKLTSAQIDKVFQTNVRAPLLLTAALINKIKRDSADIVNVSSTVGFKGYADQAAYGASKWALRGFSANLQTELKDTACRVISFCPGGFKSKLFEKASGKDNTLDGTEWMSAIDVALCLKQLLDLPKNMEVSEIVINRKQHYERRESRKP